MRPGGRLDKYQCSSVVFHIRDSHRDCHALGIGSYQDYVVVEVKFGGAEEVLRREAIGDVEIARSVASLRQSRSAFVIRRKMLEEKVTLATLARAMHVSYDRLGKVLRGQVIMTFEDEALAHVILNNYQRTREARPHLTKSS